MSTFPLTPSYSILGLQGKTKKTLEKVTNISKHMAIALNTSESEVMVIPQNKYVRIAMIVTNYNEGDFELDINARCTAKKERSIT